MKTRKPSDIGSDASGPHRMSPMVGAFILGLSQKNNLQPCLSCRNDLCCTGIGGVMRQLALILVFILSGCATTSLNRDRAVPMSSIAAFDPTRVTGRWHMFALFPETGCAPRVIEYSQNSDGTLGVSTHCSDGRVVRGTARISGPGRITVTLNGVSVEHWVLWVDEGYRTLVLGTPSGEIGWVLDRAQSIPPDRFRAAQEVLDWNGYDLSKLGGVAR